MKTEPVLFVGGPRSGQWVEVDVNATLIRVAQYPDDVRHDVTLAQRANHSKCQIFEYKREYLFGRDYRIPVFFYRESPDDCVLTQLVNGFRPVIPVSKY